MRPIWNRAQARSYVFWGGCSAYWRWGLCQHVLMSGLNDPRVRSLRIGRYSQLGGIYFVTTCTDQRKPWFERFSVAKLMCQCLTHPDFLSDAENMCWIVMPDHIHMLLQLGEFSLTRVMNRMKSKSAVMLNRELGRAGRFWQRGYYDHALRKNEDVQSVARYIVANPLRAGLVNNIANYPYWNARWL